MATRLILLLFAAAAFTGCASSIPGYIWTDVTRPMMHDFNNTPVGTKQCTVRDHKLEEPLTGYDFYAHWSTQHLKEEAMKAGITNMYYIDVRTFKVLGGIYRRKDLIIHGD